MQAKKFRGFSTSRPTLSADDYATAAAMGANLIRFFADWSGDDNAAVVSASVERAREAGLEVMLVAQQGFNWGPVVEACRGKVALWDIENEPTDAEWPVRARVLYDWFVAQDPGGDIVVQGTPEWQPLGFGRHSFHCYAPDAITMQGLDEAHAERWDWPVNSRRSYGWDRAKLLEMLSAVSTPDAILGEFSFVRCAAPGVADRWLTDVIAVAEELGISWLYHGFREDPCWDAELPDGTPIEVLRGPKAPQRSETYTTYLLQSAFEAGQKSDRRTVTSALPTTLQLSGSMPATDCSVSSIPVTASVTLKWGR